MAAPKLGTGATITYSGFTGDIMSISQSIYERESVPTSHLGTSGGMTFIPGDLYDPGTVTVEFQVTTGVAYNTPATAAASSLVFSWDTGVSMTCDAFMTSISWSANLEELQVGTAEFKLTGDITLDTTA